MSYKDVRKAKTPARVHRYRDDELHTERHARRLRTAKKTKADLATWLKQNGYFLRVFNDGHHWMIYEPKHTPQFPALQTEYDKRPWTLLCEWWPSTAKLVFRQQWKQGIHCHDWQQVISEIGLRKKGT